MKTLAQQWLEEGKQTGWQLGAREALLTTIRDGLEARFSIDPTSLLQDIEKIQDPKQLRQLVNLLFKAPSLAKFEAACRAMISKNATVNGAHLN